ncbi:MAG: putative Membrane protein [Labilithrix sp.]|nr:putative Membrane protein [Labilithrix sp.]
MTDPALRSSSPGLTPEEEDAEVSREEHGALKWAALVAALAIAYLVMPIGIGILLGMLIAFVMQPVYGRLKPRLGGAWSALAVVSGSMLVLAGAAFAAAWLFVTKGVLLARELIDVAGPGGMGDRVLGWVGARTARIGIGPEELTRRARHFAESAATRTASEANVVIGAFATGLLGAFFAMLTMHYILRNWESVALRAQETFPLRPDYTRALFAEFRRVGRTTLMGTIVTGLVQGVLATMGFLIAGVPEPIFFGVATAVASLVPAVGTMLVWVPAGVVLIAVGRPGAGTFELIWGTVMVVAFSDYYVRPRLVGGESETPSLITFAALFGGVEVFDLKGLILGPVLMSLALAVLRLYATETRLRRHITASRSTYEGTPPPSSIAAPPLPRPPGA